MARKQHIICTHELGVGIKLAKNDKAQYKAGTNYSSELI